MPEVRRWIALGVVAGLSATTMVGCSGESGSAGGAEVESPDLPPIYNPCDGLDFDAVQSELDVQLDVSEGTDRAPVCVFAPRNGDDPLVDVNYALFPGGLEQVIDQLGEAPRGARVLTPEIPGADDARIILNGGAVEGQVTGFVQNGDLVQTVNVVDPAPYRLPPLRRVTELILTDLAAFGAEEGPGT